MRSIRNLDANRRYEQTVADVLYLALIVLLAALSLAMIRFFDRL